jgi:hypothetical protein
VSARRTSREHGTHKRTQPAPMYLDAGDALIRQRIPRSLAYADTATDAGT